MRAGGRDLVAELAFPDAARNLVEPGHGGEGGLRAQRFDAHGVSGDVEIERLRFQVVIALQPGAFVLRGAYLDGIEAGMPGVEDEACVRGTDRRRIGHGERSILEIEDALQAALAAIAEYAVERAGHVELRREVGAHVAGEIEDGAGGEAIPIQRDAPMRLGEIIRAAEADSEGEGFAARRPGFQFDGLRGHVEAAGEAQGPALAVRRHAIPTVDVFQVEVAGDANVVEGAREAHAGSDVAVDAGVEAVQERDDFTDGAFFEADVEIEAAGSSLNPASAGEELAKAAGGLVCAGGFAREINVPRSGAAGGRGDIEIGIGEVEDRFGVAEFEIDAAGADVQFGDRADDGAAEKRLEIPATGLGRAAGLGDVDAGIVEADGSEFEMAREEAGQAGDGFKGGDVSERLDAEGGIFVDDDIVDGEAGAGEKAEVDGADFDFAAEGAFEGGADARSEAVAAEVGRGDAGAEQQHDGDGQPLRGVLDGALHGMLRDIRVA